MPIGAGTLDRKVTIQRKTLTSSDSGEPIETWTNIADRWSASMKPFRASEGFMIPEKTAYEQVEFRIRYSSSFVNLSPLDRIIYPALTDAQSADPSYVIPGRSIYDILGVLELDRRVGFRIITNRRPDSGGAEIMTGNREMDAEVGAYVFSGTDVLLIGAAKFLVAGVGSYNFTGTAASLSRFKFISTDSGAYNFTGTAVAFLSTKTVVAAAGSYNFIGTAAILQRNVPIAAGAGSYAFSGTDVTLTIASAYTPMWDFSDSRNSQYAAFV